VPISPVTISLLALVVGALAMAWNMVSWRRSGPRIRLETFYGRFDPENDLPEDVDDTGFQIIRVVNSGRTPADVADWGVRFLARRRLHGLGPLTKIVDFAGKLPAPPYPPIRVEPSSEVSIHALPIDRFVEFADVVGKGQTGCKFQFYVRVAGQGEVATKLVDVSGYLFAWDGRGNPPRASLKFRLQLLWVNVVLRLRRTRNERLSLARERAE
jgi:hypothetical protein